MFKYIYILYQDGQEDCLDTAYENEREAKEAAENLKKEDGCET